MALFCILRIKSETYAAHISIDYTNTKQKTFADNAAA